MAGVESITGRCYCGKVQFRVKSTRPTLSLYCHCTECRRAHAAAVYFVHYFKAEEFEYTEGEGLVQTLRNVTNPERDFSRNFCSACGTRLVNRCGASQALPSIPY